MPQAYLHDIPFDTFVKYYLNNETDVDTISSNARYQPVYKGDTTSTVYTAMYLDDKGITHCIKTLKPMPIDVGEIGKQIYNTTSLLTQTGPKMTREAQAIFKKIDRSKKKISLVKKTENAKTAFEDLRSLQTAVYDDDVGLRIDRTVQNNVIYYIPIKDAVSDFFDNLSLYEYYGKIQDKIFYAMSMSIDSGNGGKQQFYVKINEDSSTEGVGYKKIEDVITGIRVVTDQLYQDPDYDNIYYYSVINSKTRKEVGKIYQLEQHNILDYDSQGRAHFIDTYKKEGMTNYDLYFNEDDMPITPIMKYHLYMRNYKSTVASADMDPTSDLSKYSQTNTLYYKDFVDHGEIGYAYNFTETTYGPTVYYEEIIESPEYITNIVPIKDQVVKPTLIKVEQPLVSTIGSAINTSVTNLAEKMLFTASLSTTSVVPTATASTTTVVANGAKQLTAASVRRSTRGLLGAAPAFVKPSSGVVKVDLSNKASTTPARLECALAGTAEDSQFRVLTKTSASSQKAIKEFAELVTERVNYDYTWAQKPATTIRLAKKVLESISHGKLTKTFFSTDEIYKVNLLSTATVELNKALAVTAEAKAITEQDHSLQRIIIEVISNYDDIPQNHVVQAYTNLPDLEQESVGSDEIYRITNEYSEHDNESGTDTIIYEANTLFKAVNNNWEAYKSYSYKFPEGGVKEIPVTLNVMNSISDILSKYKFFQYRNNIYVMELDRPNKQVKVRNIYKYISDCIDEMNTFGENGDGKTTAEIVDTDADTRTVIDTNFTITNDALQTELEKHFTDINNFDDTDVLARIKGVFNAVGYYEKSSIHAMDRVPNNILLDKYKTAFTNVAVNTMINKESNIYSSSVITDKFDMYIYVNSLYQNLIKSLNIQPVENKGGACYDYKSNNSYFGFINYANDLVSFDYIKANTVRASNDRLVRMNDVLTAEEQTSLMHDIENQNYIRRLLNYKQYNLNAEEFNNKYDIELYRRNYKNIAESEKILETYNLDSRETRTYEEQTFGISDLVDKSIRLYTEYLYSDNNSNCKDIEDVDSPTSFNRRSLPLYLQKIHDLHNLFKLTNNDTYQLKHVFSNTDEDMVLFIEALKQKIDRGE